MRARRRTAAAMVVVCLLSTALAPSSLAAVGGGSASGVREVKAPLTLEVVNATTPSKTKTKTKANTSAPAPAPPSASDSLSTGASATSGSDDSAVPESGDGTWLSDNGLRSPSCVKSRSQACKASGSQAIPVPPGHYELDTWADSGLLGLGSLSGILLQVGAYIWSLILTVTVAVIAAVEWALSFNATGAVGDKFGGLGVLNASWGQPLAVFMLACGAIWVGWQARSSRQIGAALGSALTGFLTMGLAIAVISNPVGTVGKLADWMGALGKDAASAPLRIAHPNMTFEDGLAQIWRAVVEKPWAVLEFGDADWATNPARMNKALKSAAMEIAKKQSPNVVRQVRAAKTNADLFLIWKANSSDRNSRKKDKCGGSACLLNVMCGGEEDLTKCKGSMARYVTPRTTSAAADRLGKAVLMLIGMIPVWVVLVGLAGGAAWCGISVLWRLLLLAYKWPLALTFKPELRRVVTELLLEILGSAIAMALYGIGFGVVMTTIVLLQDFGLPWGGMWLAQIVAMFGLFFERHRISSVMRALLTQQERTAGAAGGMLGRLGSSWATGVGLRGLRASTGGFGRSRGGGGLPSQLPTAEMSAAGGRLAHPKAVTAAYAGAAGLLAGPVGSVAVAAAMERGAIAGVASDAAGRVTDGAKALAAPITGVVGRLGGRGNGGDTVLGREAQVSALLEGQKQHQLARAQRARAAMPGAIEEDQAASRAHLDAVAAAMAADPAERAEKVAAASAAMEAAQAAGNRVLRLQSAVNAGEQASGWNVNDPDSPAAQRASAWLDQQAAASPADRSYRQLAAMLGHSPAGWDRLADDRRAAAQGAIDDALALRGSRRATPMSALTRVASQQSWWGRGSS